MANIFGHETKLTKEQAKKLLIAVDNNRRKAFIILDLLNQYEETIRLNILDENKMQNRKNYTGEYVRKYFLDFEKNNPSMKKMELIYKVSNELGLSSHTVKKHIYKK